MKMHRKSFILKAICLLLLGIMPLSCISCNTSPSDTDSTSAPGEQTTESNEITTAAQTEVETESSDEHNTTPIVMLPAQEVKVFSQNMLCDEHTVSERDDAMIKSLLSIEVDSFGVQECIKAWANRLDSKLGDKYARVGVDCNGDNVGNFATYIYYLKDKYKVIASDTFWMSTTPDVPSVFNDSANMMNRTCTWAILEDVKTGFRYVHINCHLDWGDQNANVVQIQMIRDLMLRFEAMGYPVFATGDYNTKEGSVSYGQMLASELIADSRYVAKKTTNTVSHFANKSSVDFCFVSVEKMDVLEFDIMENTRYDVEVSDHNGVYTYASVYSLPAQKHDGTLVQFASDVTVTGKQDPLSQARMVISFPQARSADGMVANRYEVRMLTLDGEVVYSCTAYGNSYRSLQPLTASCILTKGAEGESYKLEITPISMFGEKGNTITQEIKWLGVEIDTNAPTNPDIVDISVKDGEVVDSSPNGHVISQNGKVTVSENAMIFNKTGNIRTSSIKNQYAKMTDGFTLSARIKTGESLSEYAHFASNLHAGGFALYTLNGKMNFVVHNGSAYISVSAAVEKNTEYHAVGVFDGTKLYLYLDGVLAGSVDLNGQMAIPQVESAQFLCIGADANADGKGESNGQCTVYSVQIFSAILTEKEINHLYQNP